jgi:hypothetical protein
MVVEKTPLSDCGVVGALLSGAATAPCPRRVAVQATSKQSATKRGLLSDLSYISQNRIFLPARMEI